MNLFFFFAMGTNLTTPRASVTDDLDNKAALTRMYVEIYEQDLLPGSQCHAASDNRNRKRSLEQR
jgi:hypothetical protein